MSRDPGSISNGDSSQLLRVDLVQVNRRLEEEIARRRASEERLAEMVAFNETRAHIRSVVWDAGEDELLREFLDGLVRSYGFVAACYWRHDDGRLNFFASSDNDAADTPAGAGTTSVALDAAAAEICGVLRAARSGRPAVCQEPGDGFRCARWQRPARGAGSNLALPLMVARSLEGVIGICASEPRAFNDERVEHLGLLANELVEVLRERRRRARVEQALKASEQRYRALVESAGEAIFSVTEDGTFLFLNSNAAGQMGGRPGDFVGRSMHELFPRPIADHQLANIRAVIRSGRRQVFEEATLIRGEKRWYRTSIAPVREPGGARRCALLVARDITERQLLQEQLIRSERLAAVGTLAGGVAHEFNNINVAILGYTQLALQHRDLPPEPRDWLQRVCRASMRAREVTHNLMTFARPQEAPQQSANVVPVIRETVNLVRSQLERMGAELHLELRPVPDTRMQASQIGQVILNLLINAMHSLLERERKRISVSTRLCDREIQIEIADTGIGIPAGDLPKIFTPFFSTKGEHAGDSPQSEVHGTGLGLSISNTIMENHGGRISVTSTPGRGSRFTLHLPLHSAPPPPEREQEEQRSGPSPAGGRILVLDDEPDTLDLVRLVLEREGHEVVTVDDPARALRRIARGGFDVVITDLQMPALHGLDFLRLLRARALVPKPILIVLTGQAGELARRNPEGVFRVLLKPFDLRDLKLVTAAALRAAGRS